MRSPDALSSLLHNYRDTTIIVSGDSTTSAVTDSLGNFWIPLDAAPPYLVLAGQFGYVPTAFELPELAPTRHSVLILDPAPILIEGITATVLAGRRCFRAEAPDELLRPRRMAAG